MKKTFFYIFSLFFMIILSGCSADYDLLITDKKKLIENITILDDNDNILKYNDSIDDFLLNQKQAFVKDGFDVKNIKLNGKSGLSISRKYNDFKSFIESPIFNKLFEKANVSSDKNLFSFETSGDYYFNEVFSVDIMSDYIYDLENVNVKIKFYNEVIKSNADEVDEKNNTYTWHLTNKNSYDNISFKLSNKVRQDVKLKDMLSRNKVTVVIIIAAIIGLLFFTVYIIDSAKKNNSI